MIRMMAVLFALALSGAAWSQDFITERDKLSGDAATADKQAADADVKAAAAKGAEKPKAEADAKAAHERAAAANAKVAAFWKPPPEGGKGNNVTYYADALNAAYEHHKKAGKDTDAKSAENAAAEHLVKAADALDKAGDPAGAKRLYERAQDKYTKGGEAAKATAAGKKAAELDARTKK